ncbi:hypothetical protein CPB84DRAFT_1788689 [Gymnopilus junonius]|uniref:Uncharacterized protein n=1 Tax=Gymnopilus junonius TaxID=109634 RepID=A0A9P5NE77_GYMJU|nr:hypothetical protein CPB84DRAFT_1788689 [Gymnopilus junonius]
MGNTILPQRVKHIKLSTRLSSRSLHHVAQEHEAAAFMESFARRHPSIQSIEIEYGIYWTGMYSVSWGRTRENKADADVQSPRDITYPGNLLSKSDPSPDVGNDGGGYSSKSSSKDHILSTVVSTIHPLPLGRLTFTEHKRKIFFPRDSTGAIGDPANLEFEDDDERRFWNLIWSHLRRFFGRNSP